MAPELFLPDGVHSFASDLWAFGCVLFELATGAPPFVSRSVQELVQLIVVAQPQRVMGASAEFAGLLDRCLEKDPAQRITWRVHDCFSPLCVWLMRATPRRSSVSTRSGRAASAFPR